MSGNEPIMREPDPYPWELPAWCGECKAPVGTPHLDGCSGQFYSDVVREEDRTRGMG